MADDANPACRKWLGIEPADLAVPHLLLGVAAGESDPLVIVRAADRRLALLRAVAQDHAVERDALLAHVEAARDAMLAAAVQGRGASPPAPPPMPSVSGLVPPPPPVPAAVVPPPVPAPPPVPPAADPDGEDGLVAGDFRVSRVRFIRRRRADHGAAALGIASLAIAVATLAVYVAWPHLQNPRHVARTHGHEASQPPTTVSTTGAKPDTTRAPKPATKERPSPTTPDPQPAPEPRPAQPPPQPTPAPQPTPTAQPSPEPPPKPMTEGEPAPPAVDVEKVRAAVSAAVAKGYESLRNLDFAAAKRHFDAVADEALDDQQATDRLQRWRQLLLYAEQYPRYRNEALASAATTTATFDCGTFQIGVVEFTARELIYRDSRRPGRNLRVSRDAIPPDVEQGLVEQWFAKDGRAANHLFLGAAALSRGEPDLAVARREWRTAADGGEPHGELLLGILDDPVVRGR